VAEYATWKLKTPVADSSKDNEKETVFQSHGKIAEDCNVAEYATWKVKTPMANSSKENEKLTVFQSQAKTAEDCNVK